MTQLDRLNTFMTERLMEAVKEIILTVGRTVREYEEETERVRSENKRLKEMLRDSGYFPEQTNADLQSCQPVSFGQPTWIPSQKEDPEPLKEIQQNQRQSEQFLHIKLEEPVHSFDTCQESANSSSNINDNNKDSRLCLFDTNPADDEVTDLPTKIKDEFINPNCSGNEDEYQSWSPHSPDLPLGTADLSRSQHQYQPTYTTNETPSTLLKHNSLSSNVHQISNHNILCTNGSKCHSKCCELQKKKIAKSSPVWRFFSLKEGDCSKAVCLICKVVISRGRKEYTTTALLRHLRMKHVDEDDMDDSPNPSKGFDDSQILNSDSINASQKTDVVDGSTSQEKSGETPDLRFADQASLSQHMQVQADMNDTGDDGPNTGSSVNTEKSSFCLRQPETLRDTSRFQDRVRCCLYQRGSLPDVTLNHVSLEKQQQLYEISAQRDGRPRPDRFAVLLFKSLIPLDIYHKWSGSVNFDGTRGKYALPNNVKKTILEATDQAFQHSVIPCDLKIIKDRINEYLRFKRTTLFPL